MSAIVFNLYRFVLGPALHILGGAGFGCRYHPSCSRYTQEAFERHTGFRAFWLSLTRVLSCHPWSRREAFDPVPVAPLNPERSS